MRMKTTLATQTIEATTDRIRTLTAATDRTGLSAERNRWDAFWMAIDAGDLRWSDFATLEDRHIDTVLRRAQTNQE